MKALSLLSGGIDSPVATQLMIEKGLHVDMIHFSNEPFITHKTEEKSKSLAERIAKLCKKSIKFYVANQGKNHAEFLKNCDRRYQCILCRRMMFRISEAVARKNGYDYLVTGENLGQVASQTLDNLVVNDKAVSIPILRPLLCYDKVEIIDCAKRIGTFETSISPGMCCNLFPNNPVTKSTIKQLVFEESKIDVDGLVKEAVANLRIMNV